MGRSILLLTLGLLTSIAIYAISGFNKPAYKVNNGYTTTVEEYSICREIQNTGMKPILIPTHSANDWQAIINAPPRGVAIATSSQAEYCCPSQCGGECSKVCTWAN
ncbi:MAG: hypothetical protein ACK41T_04470 [Pseudobdellovibrio sp.]